MKRYLLTIYLLFCFFSSFAQNDSLNKLTLRPFVAFGPTRGRLGYQRYYRPIVGSGCTGWGPCFAKYIIKEYQLTRSMAAMATAKAFINHNHLFNFFGYMTVNLSDIISYRSVGIGIEMDLFKPRLSKKSKRIL